MDDCVMDWTCTAVCPKNAVTISGYDTEQIEKKKGPSESVRCLRRYWFPEKYPPFSAERRSVRSDRADPGSRPIDP